MNYLPQLKQKNVVDNLVDKFLSLVFPKRCVSCGAAGQLICSGCEEQFVYSEIQVCPECNKAAIGGFTHALCVKSYSAERSVSIFKYSGPAKEAIGQIKYYGVKILVPKLVELSTSYLSSLDISFGSDSIFIPVPIHPIKRLERSFNQAECIAMELSKKLGPKVLSDILIRKEDTVSQTSLDRAQRELNVKGVFSLSCTQDANLVSGRDVVIIDDVFTTGATLRECAKVIKRAGARYVYLFALAKD